MSSTSNLIKPWYISGFTNADGCFSIHMEKSLASKFGWRLKPVFTITQHSSSKHVLKQIMEYFHCGDLSEQEKDCVQYRVNSFKSLDKHIIPHFQKYSLQSEKKVQFDRWIIMYNLLKQKVHRTPESFCTLLDLILSENRFPSREDKLKTVLKMLLDNFKIHQVVAEAVIAVQKTPQWINKSLVIEPLPCEFVTGFIDGDGSFYIAFRENGRITPGFSLVQSSNSLNLLQAVRRFFNNQGKIYNVSSTTSRYMIWDLKALMNLFSAQFLQFPLRTSKLTHWEAFQKVCYKLIELESTNLKMPKSIREEIIEIAYIINCEGKRRRNKITLKQQMNLTRKAS